MATNRVEVVQANLAQYLAAARPNPNKLSPDQTLAPETSLTVRQALEIFEAQVTSRELDVAARALKQKNLGFYTISSAGHEQNAIVGAQLRINDPCFLHYRSGALMMARSRKLPGSDPIMDTLLGFCASSDEPIAQGRHKVWGSRALWVPPQTSTISSHLPKAFGLALSLPRARALGRLPELAEDPVICCSFGDASANHATALSGINAARYAARLGVPLPIIFLCEDNGIGISVETPEDWVHESFGSLPYLKYFEAKGSMDTIWNTVAEAVGACRSLRIPVFLHLHCVRLWGHAGSDVESGYHTPAKIAATESADPILHNAGRLIESGAADPSMLREMIERVQIQVTRAAEEAVKRPKLMSLEEVTRPLAPWDAGLCRRNETLTADPHHRRRFFGEILPEEARVPVKRTMAALINAALADEMLRFPEIIVFGEDVARKGGVYHVTAGLQKKFGLARVFDTLLDETSVLGLAQGAGMAGLLPIPEIQYLAYIHNALDQLRGEACSLSFLSSGQFRNPMVVRLAGLGYQKGFGGHFHNDNSVGALRDIPGLMLVVPSRGDDAARLLRGALAAARELGRVVCFLEPIALYYERDLYEEGDSKWLCDYPPPGSMLLPGEPGIYNTTYSDVLLVSYGNGLRFSLRAARQLETSFGIAARVLDLRWLNPLPIEALHHHAAECGRVVVVDECRRTGGGIADAVIARLAENGFPGPLRSIRSADSYIPLGDAASLVLLSEGQIVDAVREIAGRH